MLYIGHFLIIFGIIIMCFGIAGLYKFPDLFLKLHALSKCGSSGAATILSGLMLISNKHEMNIKLFIILVFLFATSPVISHVISVGAVRNKTEFFIRK
ncbi:MAG: monovalent cation/H(+) antiporter subunit G [Candidatus Muirbacterium halophilum]|nr:monovalent cation/H(+) antiporter subunit G [Candidatus Muirbacterium halophilum]MCK9476117.1 monovalent cation/H(+) antiporter subunit G [Candidatus Muirbacterium halophilum]